MSILEPVFDRVAGGELVANVATFATKSQLRILAYHGVDDVDAFERQMEWLSRRFHPISDADVVQWAAEKLTLPDRAVWVTFDDGCPSVIRNALPILDRCGIRGTMFLCPGVVDTDKPYWWQVVQLFYRQGRPPPELPADVTTALRALKRVGDEKRRAVVGRMIQLLDDLGVSVATSQIRTDQIEMWLSAGGSLGNHTWDHPCLDTCKPAEQLDQIERSHEWMVQKLRYEPRLFAFPNGNHSTVAQTVLSKMDYQVSVLFNHRLASDRLPHSLSRLRVDDTNTLPRYKAIVSGVHPAVNRLRILGRQSDSDRVDVMGL